MTAFARVITIGRNDEMPRVATIRVGFGVDGSAIRAPITLRPNEWVCRFCDGSGEIECGSINPAVKAWSETCPHCEGEGTITIEHETAAGSGCLSTVAAGRSGEDCTPGRPTTSGMTPDARAAGDLPCFVGRKTHTVKRRVPGLSASHSPVGDMPPDAPPGAFLEAVTTFLGLAVLAGIALFFLLLT